MNNEGINNSTESSSGSSQENDHSRVQSSEASGKRKKRHSYSISTKLKVIAYAESNGKEAAARKFHVDTENLRMVPKESRAWDFSKPKEKTTQRW